MSSEEAGAGADEGGARPEAQRSLTDPKAMRAIAHPVRLALLELFEVMPTLTATQASEALGESPANCAFHLRTLAKYGFIREAGGGKGRERPWTAAQRSINVSTNGQADRQAGVPPGLRRLEPPVQSRRPLAGDAPEPGRVPLLEARNLGELPRSATAGRPRGQRDGLHSRR